MTLLHCDLHPEICAAIRDRVRLHFVYGGKPRVVEPYCHGRGANGKELLRAVQVNGPEEGRGFGKLWDVAKIEDITRGDAFAGDDPSYNPEDSALAFIHCRL